MNTHLMCLEKGDGMAIIHQGKNGLREKLNNYYEDRLQQNKRFFYKQIEEQKEAYARRVKNYRKAIPVRIAVLAVAIGLIVLLVLQPEFIGSLQNAAHDLVTGWEESLGDAMRSRMVKESEGIGEILLNLLLPLLSLIAGALLWLLRVSSGVFVLLILFGVPACIAFFAAKGLIPPRKLYFDEKFDEAAARERIQNESLSGDMRIIKVGLDGEEKALELLSRLGDDCHIYTNLMIPYDGKVSETDIIVAAPHNVTIVEVKNYQDDLVGDWSDEHIVLEAERGDTTHRNEIYNPVRQVATHAYRLSNYLREHNASAKVNRCVFFVNESIYLNQMKDANNALGECPVFERYQLEALLEYVRGQRKGKSDNQAVRLLNALASEQAEA